MELIEKPSGKLDLALTTTEDRVAAYMMGNLEESELQLQDKKQMARWLSVWQNLINFMTPVEAVDEHFNKQKKIGEEISIRTAWKDYRMATKIWGDVTHMNQKARFSILYEYSLQVFKICKDKKDRQEMNRAMKNLILLADRLKDGHSGIKPPVLVMNINVPGQGTQTFDLADLKTMNNKDLDSVIQDIDSIEIEDDELKNLLDGKSDTDQSE